ncbi:uncharacterized protein [Dysidea avara]|uniref:uncharacterized protein n=1 Tax=Dysidea avara TaxID=196820 RepID=UPI00332AD152
MSSLNSDIDTATGIFKQVVEQVAKDKQQLEEDKKEIKEEKQKWEEEKAKINSTFAFHGQVIDLNVGGTRYSTSRSTLTKYPESMLGVMFSGRHDLETMKCNDGSFFIDRDGARFKYILDYLRDGKDIVQSFPKSADGLLGLLYDAKYYQLDGLVTAINSLLREVDVISQNDITIHFKAGSGKYKADGASNPSQLGHSLGLGHAPGSGQWGGDNFSGLQQFGTAVQPSNSVTITLHSMQVVSYEHKSMKRISFKSIRFDHPVSFINCNLTGASFVSCSFGSDVNFKDCILHGTKFSNINGLVTNVNFTGSKIDNTNFDATLRSALQSARKI